MKTIKLTVLLASVFLSLLVTAHGGKVPLSLIRDFLPADLVVIVNVSKVTKVEVPTGDNQITNVYVAEADVLDTLKADLTPIPEKRKIVIVGSTVPMNPDVWKPIEKQRYLAFLRSEQGHYRYSEKFDMRPISPEGKVGLLQRNAKGEDELVSVDLDEAIKRIRSEQAGADK